MACWRNYYLSSFHTQSLTRCLLQCSHRSALPLPRASQLGAQSVRYESSASDSALTIPTLSRSSPQILGAATRDLILSVLRATATKREARNFIKTYTPLLGTGAPFISRGFPPRIILIKLQSLKNVAGLAYTLTRLVNLGATPAVVLDCDDSRNAILANQMTFHEARTHILSFANALCAEINRASNSNVTSHAVLDGFDRLTCSDQRQSSLHNIVWTLGAEALFVKYSAESAVAARSIPIIIPSLFDQATGKMVIESSDHVLEAVVASIDKKNMSLEKIVFVDDEGGIPSLARGTGAHVLINLRQEYIKTLTELGQMNAHVSHHKNIRLMYRLLCMSPQSTGIITTPESAVSTSKRNPIIYNLLTDRPLVSPSLPVKLKRTPIIDTSVVRLGMEVKSLYSKDGLDIHTQASVGNVDVGRLWDLIDKSFRRKIDVDAYLKRVNGHIAALIIAGNYEGAAIITWEGSDRNIAYLDKFAVHPTAQAGASVADIVFKEMVDKLFPHQIMWRSRSNNPVNKWYFERSNGTRKIHGTQWTMFHIGDYNPEYVDICRDIQPTWKN